MPASLKSLVVTLKEWPNKRLKAGQSAVIQVTSLEAQRLSTGAKLVKRLPKEFVGLYLVPLPVGSGYLAVPVASKGSTLKFGTDGTIYREQARSSKSSRFIKPPWPCGLQIHKDGKSICTGLCPYSSQFCRKYVYVLGSGPLIYCRCAARKGGAARNSEFPK